VSFLEKSILPNVGSINQNYHLHPQIITEVDVKVNKMHIKVEKLYRKRTETEQNFKQNYDPTVGSNHEPKTQQVKAIPLSQQATYWKSSKAPI